VSKFYLSINIISTANTNPVIYRAQERTCRSSKKTSHRQHVLDSLPNLYLFDEKPVPLVASVAKRHNSQPLQSETLTLRHGTVLCGDRQPAKKEVGLWSLRTYPIDDVSEQASHKIVRECAKTNHNSPNNSLASWDRVLRDQKAKSTKLSSL